MLNQVTSQVTSTRTVKQASTTRTKRKILHLLRHGITEMNDHLHKVGYPPPSDPMLWDTVLTVDGMAGARKRSSRAAKLYPPPQVLLVSPLTRTLQTADLAFSDYRGHREVEPLLRERLYLSSDVGTSRDTLSTRFPHYNFASLEDVWWYDAVGLRDQRPSMVQVEQLMEPEGVFKRRCGDLRASLASRPEEVIGVVSHWGVLRELTGREFENVELRTYVLDVETGRIDPA